MKDQKPTELKVKKYVRPETTIRPLNGRVFCDKILRVSKQTEAGIQLPVSFFVNDDQGNPKIEIRQNRFIVVAVAHDTTLKVIGENGDLRKLRPGDEIVPQDNPDAVGWTLPIVRDYEDETVNIFYVLHETEISGIAGYDPDIVVEDENPFPAID